MVNLRVSFMMEALKHGHVKAMFNVSHHTMKFLVVTRKLEECILKAVSARQW